MLRTPRELPSNNAVGGQGTRTWPVMRSIESDDMHISSTIGRSTSQQGLTPRPAALTELDLSRIYHEWINAGKPHHFVCSECHLPDELLGCGTCCRSYHPQCLPLESCHDQSIIFHCPSCRSKAWDQAPPQLPKSQDITPTGSTPGSIHSSPLMTRRNTPAGPSSLPESIYPQHRDDYEQDQQSENFPSVSEMYPQVLAYLAQSNSANNPSEFERQIGLMIREAESHRALIRKTTVLKEEFNRVQTENVQLRTYLNSRLPSREPVISAPTTFPSIHRPSADTSGKSWDRIVLDLI